MEQITVSKKLFHIHLNSCLLNRIEGEKYNHSELIMQLWYDYVAFSLLVQFGKCLFMQMLSNIPQVMQVILFLYL